MSSILTNTSSMVALQTLKGINSNLQKVQSEISTGKSVNSAKDNAALWAISKVMESDVAGFKAVSESLALGESSVAVARNASETVTDLLTDIKSKVIAAQESNVDREKIQTDIGQLTDQIKAVTGAAQFNGLNLVQGTEDVDILASLDRNSAGGVDSNSITVSRQDLTSIAGTRGVTAETAGGYAAITTYAGNAATGKTATSTAAGDASLSATSKAATGDSLELVITQADSATFEVTIGGQTASYTSASTGDTAENIRDALVSSLSALGVEGVTVSAGTANDRIQIQNANEFDSVTVKMGNNVDFKAYNGTDKTTTTDADVVLEQRATSVDFSTTAAVNEGDSYTVTVDSQEYVYIAGKDESMKDVANGLKIAIDSAGVTGLTAEVQDNNGAARLAIDNEGGAVTVGLSVASGGVASGGLFGLENIDVTTDDGAAAALDNIETLVQSSIDAAAEFGSVAGRIETQTDFISNLTDSLKAGIGTLVDADMEEASARLQALQVQQQLGVQSLSIANQAPQSLLSLFR